MASITITVMEIGRGEQVLNDSMADLGRMFDNLAGQGLIEPVFQVASYSESVSESELTYVREVACLLMDERLRISLKARHLMFAVLMWLRQSSTEAITSAIAAVRGEFGIDMQDRLSHLTERWYSHIESGNLTAPTAPPDVLWLPVEHHNCFSPGHGIAGTGLHTNGLCALLCPRDYYPQIMWHEALHLCFGCDDCYDESTLTRTCDLSTCVMQYEPDHSRTDRGPWLCEGQKQRIRERHRQQLAQLREGNPV